MKYIYSTCRLTFGMNAYADILKTEVDTCGYYRYTAGDDDLLTPCFVYNALLVEICIDNKHPNCEEKLSEYLWMTGAKGLIFGIITSLLNENGSVHIDGIMNFRLGVYMNDITAFFDMMRYAEIIKRGFENLGRHSIKLLEF